MKKPLVTLMAAIGLVLAGAAQSADLIDVYQVAVEADPQIGAAEAGFRAAQEVRPQARSLLLPNLNAQANRNRTDSDFTRGGVEGTRLSTATNYSLSLVQPIYNRQYWVQLSQAGSRVAQAEAQFASAQQALVVRVASAYFNVLAAQDNLTFAQAEKKAIGQQLRQAQQRFEVGLTAVTDVREAQARYDLSVAQEIVAQNQLDTAVEQLRELTGRSYESLAELQEEIPLMSPEPTNIDAWVETALEQNFELVAAQAATEIAREQVRLRRAGHWPSLNATASLGHSENPAFDLESDDTVVGLQLSVPLYQGGLISSQTREAVALFQQAQENLTAQRRATVRQARDSYQGVTAGISRVRALRQSVASAQTALQATQAGFEVGTRTAVEVLDAQRVLFGSQADYARARYDYVLSILNLKQAAGTLTVEDLRQVNSWLKG